MTTTATTVYVDVRADHPDELERYADTIAGWSRGCAMASPDFGKAGHWYGGADRSQLDQAGTAVRLACTFPGPGAASRFAWSLADWTAANRWTCIVRVFVVGPDGTEPIPAPIGRACHYLDALEEVTA